ncbi:MAG: RNA-binding cell elongation regulator Jag/EloR [Aminobacterium sp.]|jgi:spoIIIJ-associated protein|uniref:R3H domain-containing protein n=1 Tax=bioreactor metagenome TaxID=1076179 RepID=A0A645FRS6_9ZZZZ|nr:MULTISPECIES: RNA-binding cell elongation regulator Jag/EloR [unclassified Aminobacterium]MDD2206509.1 KH domain-containing protein [Aminobacterium sp.]MDD3426675.1 KH domain-containing protein [Aminobacterium sp.]MDD3707000.1 KH domain-containing protein [Aminobacterium sp.]MDD4228427.1 KH domain-containing protein [Aminobacterium sp.]MDD4551350.1 KH domain-containing protein [Aminobacterium sp.]
MTEQDKMILEVGSVDEAKRLAAAKLGLHPEDFLVKIIEEEKSFFGLLGKKLRVEVWPEFPLLVLKGQELARNLIQHMGLSVTVQSGDDDFLNLSGDDAGIVIGKYGETLKAMEYLINLMLREESREGRVKLDSDGYRQRREASLQRLALAAARKVEKRGRPAYLEPMSSWERRIIHLTLKDYNNVTTRSVGEEPSRKVVVCPVASSRNRRH